MAPVGLCRRVSLQPFMSIRSHVRSFLSSLLEVRAAEPPLLDPQVELLQAELAVARQRILALEDREAQLYHREEELIQRLIDVTAPRLPAAAVETSAAKPQTWEERDKEAELKAIADRELQRAAEAIAVEDDLLATLGWHVEQGDATDEEREIYNRAISIHSRLGYVLDSEPVTEGLPN